MIMMSISNLIFSRLMGIRTSSSVISKEVVAHKKSAGSVLLRDGASTTRSGVNSRAKQLVKSIRNSSTPDVSSSHPMTQRLKLQELSKHLLKYPEAGGACIKEGAIPVLLRLRENSSDTLVSNQSRQVLALLGYTEPPKGRGIRILSIDGGGIRGVVILEVLKKLEQLTGTPVHKMFDLICGVSTGAILTMLVGALKTDITKCEQLYSMVSKNLFVSDFWRGTSRLILTHAYYDTSVWEKILKEVYGSEKSLIDTNLDEDVPRVMAISSSMSPKIRPYVFRNFNLPHDSVGYYEGSANHKIWQSVRASSSAPGYFEEYVLESHIHQDGGILINNPAAIAIHEAGLLWPEESIQCLISIGTGRYTPPAPISSSDPKQPSLTSLRNKISSILDSATDTEVVHRLLQDLLPQGTYFRMNPVLSEWLGMDENRPEKLEQLRTDAQMYVRKNEFKMTCAAEAILKDRTIFQRVVDSVKLQYQLF